MSDRRCGTCEHWTNVWQFKLATVLAILVIGVVLGQSLRRCSKSTSESFPCVSSGGVPGRCLGGTITCDDSRQTLVYLGGNAFACACPQDVERFAGKP